MTVLMHILGQTSSSGVFDWSFGNRKVHRQGPCGLMDKALVFGTKDCRFESCQGHLFIGRLVATVFGSVAYVARVSLSQAVSLRSSSQ